MVLFLLLSMLSGWLEIGTLFFAVHRGLPVWEALLLPAMYQAGNLLHMYSIVEKSISVIRGIGLVIMITNIWIQSTELLCVEVLIASVCLQHAREKYKKECPTWLKRSARIAGFALSLLMAYCPEGIIGICLVLSLFSSAGRFDHRNKSGEKGAETKRTWVWVMVLHQMHYFVYIYVLILFAIRSRTGSLFTVALFCTSWVVYLLPQTIAEKLGWKKLKAMFFICHSFLGAVIVGMCIADILHDTTAVYVLWIMTGLGGGSVFCIKELTGQYKKTNMNYTENFGHILGVAVAIGLTVLFPDAPAAVYLAASALFVILTLTGGLISVRKESQK